MERTEGNRTCDKLDDPKGHPPCCHWPNQKREVSFAPHLDRAREATSSSDRSRPSDLFHTAPRRRVRAKLRALASAPRRRRRVIASRLDRLGVRRRGRGSASVRPGRRGAAAGRRRTEAATCALHDGGAGRAGEERRSPAARAQARVPGPEGTESGRRWGDAGVERGCWRGRGSPTAADPAAEATGSGGVEAGEEGKGGSVRECG